MPNDLTYTVERGTFTTTQLELDVKLPPLSAGDGYNFFEIHNISFTTATGQINALLYYMLRTRETGYALSWSNNDPLHALPDVTNTSTGIIQNPSAPPFDWDAQDTLIAVFHEPKQQEDVNSIQRAVEVAYALVNEIGPFNTVWPYVKGEDKPERENKIIGMINMFFIPRKIGMTIITKP